MKTTIPVTRVYYTPPEGEQKAKLMYEGNGKLLFGFEGHLAEKEFQKVLDSETIEIVIRKPENMKSKKIQQFHAILNKKGLMDMKSDIIAQYGVESTKELTLQQLNTLIDRLNGSEVPAPVRKARSSVLHQLSKLGVTGSAEDGFDRVNGYLCHPRIAGKTLYAMTLDELKACTRKLRAIREKGVK